MTDGYLDIFVHV